MKTEEENLIFLSLFSTKNRVIPSQALRPMSKPITHNIRCLCQFHYLPDPWNTANNHNAWTDDCLDIIKLRQYSTQGNLVRQHKIPDRPTKKRFSLWIRAFCMVLSWVEMTDRTDASIRLNSSKQLHAPHWQHPDRIFPTAFQANRWMSIMKSVRECSCQIFQSSG